MSISKVANVRTRIRPDPGSDEKRVASDRDKSTGTDVEAQKQNSRSLVTLRGLDDVSPRDSFEARAEKSSSGRAFRSGDGARVTRPPAQTDAASSAASEQIASTMVKPTGSADATDASIVRAELS